MGIAGSLAAFSLTEVLQVLNRGRKTGQLSICVLSNAEQEQFYYIWLDQGRIVAIADQLNGNGLFTMLNQRSWLSEPVTAQLSHLTLDTPLGLFLKTKGVLQADQIRLLFHAQVLQRICTLFKFRDGQFKFEEKAPLPYREMTGLSLPAIEAILLGLRVLKDWTAISHKLPKPDSALAKLGSSTSLPLDSLERKVWDSANETLTLSEMAAKLHQSLPVIQQAAFRLKAIGLVEETPTQVLSATHSNGAPDPMPVGTSEAPPSKSFLQGLVSFLRSRI